jgi:16S rRNA (guanine966-N2)-methyltransferase
VTRLIGGTAGGRRLRTPRGSGTRPTADRVREALFSAVEARLGGLQGVRVLDLYAGSGAVGLEAWSRGAAAVTLVEQHREALAAIRANAGALAPSDPRVTVVAAPVRRHLSVPPDPARRFGVAFLDPPYDLPDTTVVGDLEALAAGWLTGGALVVVERSARGGSFKWPTGYDGERDRGYGETVLRFATWDDGTAGG